VGDGTYDNQRTDSHTDGSEDHHLATSESINDEERKNGGSKVQCSVTSSEEARKRRTEAKRTFENRSKTELAKNSLSTRNTLT
jgi:hypothetical protein